MNTMKPLLRKPLALLLSAALLVLLPSFVQADPTGIFYDVLLDGDVVLPSIDPNDPNGFMYDTEGHLGEVVFDGLADEIPNDIVPNPPFTTGNPLGVTEMLTSLPGGGEEVQIWIEGQDPAQPFPNGGFPLFNNTLDPSVPVYFEITGLHWNGAPAITVSQIQIILTENGLEQEIFPTYFDLSGQGIPSDPLDFYFELDPLDFTTAPFSNPTDLHVHFIVEHIPEPGTIVLAMLTGLTVISWRRRRGN